MLLYRPHYKPGRLVEKLEDGLQLRRLIVAFYISGIVTEFSLSSLAGSTMNHILPSCFHVQFPGERGAVILLKNQIKTHGPDPNENKSYKSLKFRKIRQRQLSSERQVV